MDAAGAGLAWMVGPPPLTAALMWWLVEVTLHRDGLLDVDAAGAGAGVEVEGGLLPTVR